MKNVTLSIPDELLAQMRQYAKEHGTTLNDMIRDFMQRTTNNKKEVDFLDKIEGALDELGIDTSNYKFNREDLYER